MKSHVTPVTEPNTIRSSDIYYASKQPASIQESPADSFQRPGAKPVAVPTPAFVQAGGSHGEPNTLQTTDRYYADGGMAVHQPPKPDIPQQPETQDAPVSPIILGRTTAPQTIHSVTEVPEAIKGIVQLLVDGYTSIRVSVSSQAMLAAARTQLELAVAREAITEAQSREVRFGWTQVRDLTTPPSEQEINALPKAELDIVGGIDDPWVFVKGEEKQAVVEDTEDLENVTPDDMEDDWEDELYGEEEFTQ